MKLLNTVKNFFHTSPRQADNASALIAIVREVSRMDGFRFNQFSYYLSIYQQTKTAILARKPNANTEIEQLNDYCEAIRVCLEGFHCKTIDTLCYEIEGLFGQSLVTFAA